MVLVDHNEPRQALAHLEDADLLEILDHHRLGNPSTHTPIRFTVDIVGSTSTLVSEQIEEAGLAAPPQIAGMLLSGLLSDTLILTSPTTTERDKKAAERLGRWAFVKNSPLAGETVQSYGEQVVSAGAGLSSRDPGDMVSTDLKAYEAGNYRFAIAQAEVTDLLQLTEHLDKLNTSLKALRDKRALDFAMLMVTDVVRGSSRLLVTDEPPELGDLPYPAQPDGTRRGRRRGFEEEAVAAGGVGVVGEVRQNGFRKRLLTKPYRSVNLFEFEQQKFGKSGQVKKSRWALLAMLATWQNIMAEKGRRIIPDSKNKLEHELADCFWSIIVLANMHKIDLDKATYFRNNG